MAETRKIGRLVAVRGNTPHPHSLRPARITAVGAGTTVDCKVLMTGGETYAALPRWSRLTPTVTGWIRA